MKHVNHILMLFLILSVIFISMCNPVSENIDDPLWNSLHNAKPFQSNYFHSADYRFPHGACDEVQCHGTSLTGGNSGAPSCTKCHDDQWTIFGVTHTAKVSGYYHSYHVNDAVDIDDNTIWFSNCKTCHGGTLDGNTAYTVPGEPEANFPYRYSCKVCHSGFSGSIPPPGHSKKRESAWHRSGGSCIGNACHGSDGESSVPASGLFGRSPACSECHDGDK